MEKVSEDVKAKYAIKKNKGKLGESGMQGQENCGGTLSANLSAVMNRSRMDRF